jgi:hypothetical protein
MRNVLVFPSPFPMTKEARLRRAMDSAFDKLCEHRNPGNLAHDDERAWQMEHLALGMMFEAAVLRHRSELEWIELIKSEQR